MTRTIFAYWLLLVLGMIALGIGLAMAFTGSWVAASTMILLAILLVLLALVTKGNKA